MGLTAEFSDASGRTCVARAALGDCGWSSPWDCIGAAGVAVVKGVATAVGTAARVTHADDLASLVNQGVSWTCDNVFTTQTAKAAIAVGATIPSPYTAGAAVAATGGTALCSTRTQPATPSSSLNALLRPAFQIVKSPPVPMFPAGTIQWFNEKASTWKIAVPMSTAGLGAVPAYWRVATSDHPYLTAASQEQLGAAAAFQIQTAAAPAPNVPIVSQADGEKATGTQPFYKKLTFWLIAGGASAVATASAIAVVRYRRKHAA